MKKRFFILICIVLLLSGCSKAGPLAEAETETVFSDYEEVVEIAKDEFYSVFSEHDDLKITETSAMVRSDDETHIVIQFQYESGQGSGVYGFEYQKDGYGNYELRQHGGGVTVNHLVK